MSCKFGELAPLYAFCELVVYVMNINFTVSDGI